VAGVLDVEAELHLIAPGGVELGQARHSRRQLPAEQGGDPPAPVRRPDDAVVVQDGFAVGGEPDVRLDAVRAAGDGAPEGGQRVLPLVPGRRAAVCEGDGRAEPR
jgi:hypothetical protein